MEEGGSDARDGQADGGSDEHDDLPQRAVHQAELGRWNKMGDDSAPRLASYLP